MSSAFAPIVRARPCPIFGRPVHRRVSPLITARYFSSNPSDSGSLRPPCPPGTARRWLQVHLGCIRLSPLCPFRLFHTFLLLPASEELPPPLDTAPLIRAPRGL